MHLIQPQLHSRRAFLRRSAQLAFTGAALPTALNLAAMGEAAAQTATDYKALVCVFLFGGNDYANTLVTYDQASHDLYAGIRSNIAIARADLTNTALVPTAALPGGREYALHPAMTGLASVFNAGQAAAVLNVGPLIGPLTKAQYQSRNTALYPPKLFSHNDQQSIWQSSSPEGSTVGWGGNLGDLALQNNSNSNSLFTCISVSGNTVFLSGDTALAYQVSAGGAVKIRSVTDTRVYGSSAVKNAIAQLAQQSSAHVLENEYNKVTRRAIGAESSISAALAGSADINATTPAAGFEPFNTTVMTDNSLAAQMKMVARLIAARNTLGAKRQVFFVSLGGFDLHDNLVRNQPTLMRRVSDAMTAFYQTTVNLGVANDVTAFTASDFGRTLSSNGDGSDHGWGSHHLVVGGAVKGKAFYGYAPPVSVGSSAAPEDQWHVGQGRLLPSTSTDQYAATLASWFGVPSTELGGILPNLQNFGGSLSVGGESFSYPKNLGFL
jgi:uncharacterized protein (DUF1501 family)